MFIYTMWSMVESRSKDVQKTSANKQSKKDETCKRIAGNREKQGSLGAELIFSHSLHGP